MTYDKYNHVYVNFTPMLISPDWNDPKYIHTSAGGLNPAQIQTGGRCLPNCTGFIAGWEIGVFGHVVTNYGWAGKVWDGNFPQGKGQTPKLGAIACWLKNGSSQEGHVGVVMDIEEDGTIVLADSAYQGRWFGTWRMPSPYLKDGMTFQGFGYCIDYSTAPVFNPQVGDVVFYKGGSFYSAPDSDKQWNGKPGLCVIKEIVASTYKHPFKVKRLYGEGSNVDGYVNFEDLQERE